MKKLFLVAVFALPFLTNAQTKNLDITGTIKGTNGVFDSSDSDDPNTKWRPLNIGREYAPGLRSFSFISAPNSNSNGYIAFTGTDRNKVLRLNFAAAHNESTFQLKNSANEYYFTTGNSMKDNNFSFAQLPRANSQLIIGGYAGNAKNKNYKLVVENGSALIQNSVRTNELFFDNYGGRISMKDSTWIRVSNSIYTQYGILRTDRALQVGPNGSKFHVNSSGNVSIGTNSSYGYRLSVNGKIRASEIKVYTGWADYVFKEDYKLPTIEEVAAHIKENGHLKNIPSEAEVLKEGIHLGEMSAKLLEKIEELTLYVIDLNTEVKTLKAENKRLNETISNLK